MPAYNRFTDGQAQAGAFAHILGGEERIENLGKVDGGDAAAVVCHLDNHLLIAAARADGDASALPAGGLDGLDRVDQEVQQHLTDLRTDAGNARRCIVLLDDINAAAAEPTAKDLQAGFHQ